NVLPSQIEHVLMQIPEAGVNYEIVVDMDVLDKLLVKVEVTEKVFSDKLADLLALEKKIERELKEVLNVYAKVELVSPGSIPRTPGKAKRIIDLRKDKI
ncbi:MAG: phenylacetate--CoA ligase, partial [Candidatus Hydrothermarchaeota archaeon]